MTRDEIVALFDRRTEAWNRHDAAATAAYHAEDAIGESPVQGRMIGRQRIQDGYTTWMTAFPDVKIVTDDVLVEGSRVVQFFTMTGTQKGSFHGLPATGRKFQITGVFLATIDDGGLITHDRRLYDVTNMLVQLGALRAKPVEDPQKAQPAQRA
jgi:steroid delta-isomerase-like uncharacterized protein